MEILKKQFVLQSLVFLGLILSGCGNTITKVDYLETDTYISTADPSNHSELPYLNISKNSQVEERTIIKLPTGKRDTQINLSETLKNPLAIPLIPYIILIETFEAIFNCKGQPLVANNLINAQLVFNIAQNQEGALDGKLNLNLLVQPWWQSTTWDKAHPFSEKGKWSTPGGDIDPAFPTVLSSQNSNTVVFDITAYLKTLLSQSQPVHFGMLIHASGDTLGSVSLASVQSTSSYERPKVVSTYRCLGVSSPSYAFELGQ